MARFPVESRLRPAPEFASAATCMAASLVLLAKPGLFLLGGRAALMLALILVLLAVWRAAAGFTVLKYRLGLTRLPEYRLSSRDMPWSTKTLFLGLGFRWDALWRPGIRGGARCSSSVR